MWNIHGYLSVASAVRVKDKLRSGLEVTLSQRMCHTFHISKNCVKSTHIVWLLLFVHHKYKYSYNDMRQSSV